MTSFILLQNVAYEGSTLKGIFASLELALDHIDKMDGYYLEDFTVDRDTFQTLDGWDFQNVQNVTAGWVFRGPGDLTFTIYACSLGGE